MNQRKRRKKIQQTTNPFALLFSSLNAVTDISLQTEKRRRGQETTSIQSTTRLVCLTLQYTQHRRKQT